MTAVFHVDFQGQLGELVVDGASRFHISVDLVREQFVSCIDLFTPDRDFTFERIGEDGIQRDVVLDWETFQFSLGFTFLDNTVSFSDVGFGNRGPVGLPGEISGFVQDAECAALPDSWAPKAAQSGSISSVSTSSRKAGWTRVSKIWRNCSASHGRKWISSSQRLSLTRAERLSQNWKLFEIPTTPTNVSSTLPLALQRGSS